VTNYYPILKAKQGELTALEHDAAPHYEPVIEVVPWERDAADADLAEASESAEVDKLDRRLLKAWRGKTTPLFLDTASAENDPADGWSLALSPPLLASALQRLRPQIDLLPVFRLPSDHAYIEVVGEAAKATGATRAMIRVTAEDLDDVVSPLRESVERVARYAGYNRSEVDVLVDFGDVDEGKMAMAARLARFILPQLDGEGWRSLVIGAGAFPVNLSEVSPATLGQIERYDYRLWQTLSAMKLRVPIDFADYATAHPELQTGTPFAAPPQLRYTLGDTWVVGKGRRNDRRGHKQFWDICDLILKRAGARAAPEDASWGDERIATAARQAHQEAGPERTGNASTWRAIATSHHLALVPRQLAAAGAS
jgi:hypothetical protein